jgi:hypothetical protein
MKLRGHSHTAAVRVTFGHDLSIPGWPSFEATNRWLADKLREAVAHPVDGTNEDVARLLWETAYDAAVDVDVNHPGPFEPFATCRFWLLRLELDVLGVPDAIGHDAGATTYTIERNG